MKKFKVTVEETYVKTTYPHWWSWRRDWRTVTDRTYITVKADSPEEAVATTDNTLEIAAKAFGFMNAAKAVDATVIDEGDAE